jgi:tRNA pseudouridine38-40 synthase
LNGNATHTPAEGDTVRLKLTVAYKGTRFFGWQLQAHESGQQRTVQGCLEQAFHKILGRPVRLYAAGRTDSGVHALGQVAHVDVPAHKLDLPWQRALNANLPNDACVVAVEPAPPDFHARYSAVSKVYAYSLWLTRRYVLPQRLHYVWPVGGLDLEAMDRAACHLLGEHDFASFRNTGSDTKTSVRTVMRLERSTAPDSDGMEVVWTVQADGFLKQMVRNIVGTLVEVGRGGLEPGDVPAIQARRDRSAAPATAPAKGLTLREVHY